jgi:hypothetical protein
MSGVARGHTLGPSPGRKAASTRPWMRDGKAVILLRNGSTRLRLQLGGGAPTSRPGPYPGRDGPQPFRLGASPFHFPVRRILVGGRNVAVPAPRLVACRSCRADGQPMAPSYAVCAHSASYVSLLQLPPRRGKTGGCRTRRPCESKTATRGKEKARLGAEADESVGAPAREWVKVHVSHASLLPAA